MKLKAFMINVRYNFIEDYKILPSQLIATNGNTILEIDNISILDERDYESGTVLGEEHRAGWVINTHYRGHGKYSKKTFYQIAFRMELEEDEKIEDYFLSVRGTSVSHEGDILRYSDKYDLFFDTTLYEYTRNGFRVVTTKGIANDSAGRFFVDIKASNNSGDCYRSIPVMVLPSSITYDDYINMIEELFIIRDDLVINDDAKIGLANKWDIKMNSIEQCIENITYPLININNNPAMALKSYPEKMSYNNIKKLTPRTLIDRELYPYKNKYLTQVSIEDVNTYENKSIKYALKSLKNKVNQYQKRFDKEIIEHKNNIEKVKNQFQEITKQSVYEKRNLIQNKKDQSKKIINNFEKNEEVKKGDMYLDFNVFKEHYFEYSTQVKINIRVIDNKFFKLDIESTWDKNRNKYDFDLKYGEYSYKVIDVNKEYQSKFYGRPLNCTLKTTDINQLIFLVKSLEEEYGFINIEANAIRKSRILDDPFNGEIIIGHRYRKFNIELTEIIAINGIEARSYSEDEIGDFLSDYSIDINENEQDSLGFLNSIVEKEDRINNLKDSFSSNLGWRSVENEIDEILALPIFNNISDEILPEIIPTQIFINHSAYNQVYYSLTNLEKEIKFIKKADSNDILVKSTCDIYEIWCLWKIIDVLVNELRWSISNKEEVIGILDSFLSAENKYKEIPLIIELKHKLESDVHLNLKIVYEGRIYYTERRFKTPDYQFIFQVENEHGMKGELKRFYLDAKYRNYTKQDNNVESKKNFHKDIKEVAIDKYIRTFENIESKPISSFIIHSDQGENYTDFGGYVTEEDMKIYDYKNNHTYGAFSLIPSDANNLRKYIKLIIEYHLELYNYCWNCGETTRVEKKVKKTKGGNNKYHYTCKSCSEFWVKNHCYVEKNHTLIKHIDNYHYVDVDKGTPWFVVCPECGSDCKSNLLDFEECF